MKLLLRFSTILNIFFFSILSAQSFNFNEIDTSNTEALRNLVLTPELVAAAAAKTSKRLKGILVARESAQSNRLVAESLFDTKLEAKAGWVENDKEAASPFALNNQKTFNSSLEASRYFSTGTMLNAKISHTHFEAATSTLPVTQFSNHEPSVQVNLSQQLLRDFLGKSSRKNLMAGEMQAEALQLMAEEAAEEWVIKIVGYFIEAWKLQQNLYSLDENVSYRERLVKTAIRKKNRGTLEDKDFRKIEASLIDLKATQAQVNDALKKLFHLLVRSAELPEYLLSEDVRNIKLSLGSEFNSRVNQFCKESNKWSRKEKSSELLMKAAALRADTAYDLNLPSLSAFASIAANSVDDKSAKAWGDISKDPQLEWMLGLKAEWKWGDRLAKGQTLQALAEKYKAEADFREAQDEKIIGRADECKALERNSLELKNRELASNSLKKSYQQYEQDFNIGRSGVFEVVQAAEEWIRSRDAFAISRAQSIYAWWKLQDIDGKIYDSLNDAIKAKQKMSGAHNE